MGALREAYERDGFVVVPGLFSSEEAARFRGHFMRMHEARREDFDKLDPTGKDPLAKFPRIIHPHRHDEASLCFLLDQRLFGAIREITGDEPLAAQTMFYFKPPGARGQALHQDNMYLRAEPGTCLAAWLAVDECDEENGCLQVVPGSHTLPMLCPVQADTSVSFTGETVPVPDGFEARPVIMQAGDVLFFHGAVIHGSGPNTSTDRFRRSLIAHYITGDARQASLFYHPLLRADGTVAELAVSPGGGQCGMVEGDRITLVDRPHTPAGPVP